MDHNAKMAESDHTSLNSTQQKQLEIYQATWQDFNESIY